MFALYPGYPNGIEDVVDYTYHDDAGLSLWVKAPNVLRVVREQLACDSLQGAELEDDGGPGSIGSHWEQRLFQVGKGVL
jgi:hypothetical protein